MKSTKLNAVTDAERKVLKKMSDGYELFYWGAKPTALQMSKITRGEFGTTTETLRKKLFLSLLDRKLISESHSAAGRTFYVLTPAGRQVCS